MSSPVSPSATGNRQHVDQSQGLQYDEVEATMFDRSAGAGNAADVSESTLESAKQSDEARENEESKSYFQSFKSCMSSAFSSIKNGLTKIWNSIITLCGLLKKSEDAEPSSDVQEAATEEA